jgi:WhiB family redox-sensing transcriptional regulator
VSRVEMEWMDDAACQDMDQDLFYPPSGGKGLSLAKQAKAICQACPVVEVCREEAIRKADVYGVRGGLGPKELEKEVKARYGYIPSYGFGTDWHEIAATDKAAKVQAQMDDAERREHELTLERGRAWRSRGDELLVEVDEPADVADDLAEFPAA